MGKTLTKNMSPSKKAFHAAQNLYEIDKYSTRIIQNSYKLKNIQIIKTNKSYDRNKFQSTSSITNTKHFD